MLTRDQLRRAAEPDEVRRRLRALRDDLATAAHGHHHGELVDVRTSEHGGHRIVVRTRYEITVDDAPFDVPVVVSDRGRVHYHGLPTTDFPSVIDLVAAAIDTFGDDVVEGAPTAAPAEPGHHAHGGH